MHMLSFLGSTVVSGAAVPQVVSAANPLPVTLSGGIGGLAVAGTIAAGAAAAGQFPVTVGGVDGGGLVRQLLTDATGVLQVNASLAGGAITANQGAPNTNPNAWPVSQATAANFNATVTQGPGNVANAWTVGGPVASGGAIGGNPLTVGGDFNTTAPTVTTGQRVPWQMSSRGFGLVQITSGSGNPAASVTNPSDGQGASSGLSTWSQNAWYNGATWDRGYKPRTAFRLPSSALSNNAANIKATPGSILGPITGNVTLAASTCYLKFFDTTGTPNPAALAPLYTFACNIVNGAFVVPCPIGGLYFPTGIGVAIVANPADLDNTAIAAGQITALNVPFQ